MQYLHHVGYISALTVQGSGPIPGAKQKRYEHNPSTGRRARLLGQEVGSQDWPEEDGQDVDLEKKFLD